ncbi:MAG TPA: family 10 glycosylhydrolase, partial [Flavisolibacter sp.]|nr:family 10 glycosylhydrolase [Flavisolibacter sp.]
MRLLQKITLPLLILAIVGCSKKTSSPGPTPPPTPPPVDPNVIRGAWVTTTASTALNSLAEIKQTVATFKAAGLNQIFVVVYNNARTVYPSTVMQNLIGKQIKEGFEGRDPLQEMITEAHAAGMKVHAWFEYGFASSFSANGGAIVAARPTWAGRDIN